MITDSLVEVKHGSAQKNTLVRGTVRLVDPGLRPASIACRLAGSIEHCCAVASFYAALAYRDSAHSTCHANLHPPSDININAHPSSALASLAHAGAYA